MVDLNKHFIVFAKNMTTSDHRYDADDHNVLDKLLFAWKNTPSKDLDGITPHAYVDGLTPKLLVESLKYGENILINDKIAKTTECAPLLKAVIEKIADKLIDNGSTNKEPNENLIDTCIKLLSLIGKDEPIAAYVSLLKKDITPDFKERIIDRLKLNADASRPILLSGIDNENIQFKTVAGEILLEAQKDEVIFKLLIDLFLSGENIPLYASFLGKYGDERAAVYLYSALDKADYVDFIEIKNAIERLGGLVDDSYRDFTLDPLYHLLKENENK